MSPEDLHPYRITGPLNQSQKNTVVMAAIIAIGLFLLAIKFGWPALQDLILTNQLLEATITQGTIIDKYSTGGDAENPPDNFYIVYRLDEFADGPDDPNYQKASRVDKERYFELQEGDTIDVRYDPDNPTISMAQETFEASGLNYLSLCCSGCFLLITVLLAFAALLGFRYDIGQALKDTVEKGSNRQKIDRYGTLHR